MKHTIDELYRINGKQFYTDDYLDANAIQKAKRHGGEGWSYCYSLGTNKDTITIHTATGTTTGYAYGEKTWFDSREERDVYRAERNRQKAEQVERNALLKTIMQKYENMAIEQLREEAGR